MLKLKFAPCLTCHLRGGNMRFITTARGGVDMPAIIAITVIIQGFFIYHVFSTGRPYWWAFIILSMPVLGCLVYYLIEVFPNSREHRSARRVGRNLARSLKPDAEMKRRIEEAEICGSIANKTALAEECLAVGLTHDAIRLYQSCLAGPHANDPVLIWGLARAYFENGAHALAMEQIQGLQTNFSAYKPSEIRLLKARTLEEGGDTFGALAEYEEITPNYVGLEAKYRYALLLKNTGHLKQADSLFQEILSHAKRFNVNMDTEKAWVGLAQQNLSTS